jgi:galactitol-specific phosphotransferase system IIC component
MAIAVSATADITYNSIIATFILPLVIISNTAKVTTANTSTDKREVAFPPPFTLYLQH